MFNNLTKLTKILYLNERKFNGTGFVGVGALAVLRLTVSIKYFG